MSQDFVHLHTHSHYSLLDGLSKVTDLVAKAKEFGMEALALTDHGAMYGAIEFYKECQKAGIKPIVGVETYIANRTRFDKDASLDRERYHLTLLAKNNAGYKNLMKAVSKSYLEGFYYKPRMDKDLLKEHAEGVICLSGCPASEFVSYLHQKRGSDARKLIQFYIDTFGKEHTFIEIMLHGEAEFFHEWYAGLVPEMRAIAQEFDLPIVGTWDSHYLCKDDAQAHGTLLKINTNGGMEEIKGNFSFINQDDAYKAFAEIPEAAVNTKKVADLVDIEIEFEPWKFPTYPIPDGSSYDEELRKLVLEGLPRKGYVYEEMIKERVDYELDIIKQKGFSSYFLVESDLVNAAKRMGIYTNTRGSAAGSLVSYATGITSVDPIRYKLPFERFMNPLRPGIPDIDLDIADNRRDDLIGYIKERYGEKSVAQIGTFGTMMARAAVRDVARAMGFPYTVGDKIAKVIPLGSQGFPMTIERALEIEPDFKKMYDSDQDVKTIVDMAKKLEGNVRHISVHAAGVVISPTGDVTDFTPIQYDPKGEEKIITQYSMYTGGRDGVVNLPKFDLLGLRNLNFIAETIERVKKIHGIDIDIENIPLDDTKVFEMLSRGETMGVFQMASSGMTRYIKELRPSKVEDLMAMVALYRPGPMQFIPDYIKRKHNPRLITYPDPKLKDILESSYGVLIYQDDLLLISIQIAGYDWGEADKFRKAVGKKIPEEMAKQKDRFIQGCIDHSKWNKEKATKLWDWIEPFAAYGFNKAHSASYGLLAYRTAYLKANYPAEYMTACMTAESGDIETVSEYIAEAKNMGFQILPPDVNESFRAFTAVMEEGKVTKNIRFGLGNIKNLGDEIAGAIIQERRNHGKFTSIENFLERITHKNLNKKSLEALIMSGAMESLGERGQLLSNMEILLSFNKELARSNGGSQASLFATLDSAPQATLRLKPSDPTPQDRKLSWEKELLGLYISGHPLDKWKDRLENVKIKINHLLNGKYIGMTTAVCGIIENIKELYTKRGDKMALFTITDLTGSITAVAFPEVFQKNKELVSPDRPVIIKGTVNSRNGERNFIVDSIKIME